MNNNKSLFFQCDKTNSFDDIHNNDNILNDHLNETHKTSPTRILISGD